MASKNAALGLRPEIRTAASAQCSSSSNRAFGSNRFSSGGKYGAGGKNSPSAVMQYVSPNAGDSQSRGYKRAAIDSPTSGAVSKDRSQRGPDRSGCSGGSNQRSRYHPEFGDGARRSVQDGGWQGAVHSDRPGAISLNSHLHPPGAAPAAAAASATVDAAAAVPVKKK